MSKRKFRFYILLFSVAIFILTALGLAFLYYKTLVPPFWFIFAYIVAWVLVFSFAAFLIGDGKLSRKKFLLLTFGVMIMSTTVTHSVWTIVTPRWSFSVTTDKSTYELGENVQITVTLKNLGFIAHSFESSLSDPVWISIEYQHPENPTVTLQVWYSQFHKNTTEFSIKPKETLERNFIWNQTDIHRPEKEIKPGTYLVIARVPIDDPAFPLGYNLFSAWTSINITQDG